MNKHEKINSVLVLIPIYNEARQIVPVINSLRERGLNYLIINDGSEDETKTLLEQYHFNFVSHSTNRGQGAALRTGFSYALKQGFEIVVHFDGDGQHDPNDIHKLIAPLLNGEYDIIFGSRFLTNTSAKLVPFSKRWILKLARIFEGMRSGIWLSDAHCGFRALKLNNCKAMNLKADRMAHASEILSETKRLNLRYKEVSVKVRYDIKKKENNLRRILEVLSELIKNSSNN